MHMKIFSLRRINKKIKKMRSENKVLSLRQRDEEKESCKSSKIRKNLHETFVNEELPSGDILKMNEIQNTSVMEGRKCIGSNVLSRVNLSNSRKAIASGAEKIGKTFRRMGSTFGNISQRFRLGSRRRQRLTENITHCHTPATPQARCRQVLGRTPTKLYSPFGIETPRYITERDHHNINPDTPDHMMSPRKKRKSVISWKFMRRHPRSLFH